MRPNFFENFKSSGSYLQKLGGWQLIKMSAVFFKLSKNCSFFRRLLLVHILFNGRPSKQVLNRCFSIIQDGHFLDCSHIESTLPLSNTHTHTQRKIRFTHPSYLLYISCDRNFQLLAHRLSLGEVITFHQESEVFINSESETKHYTSRHNLWLSWRLMFFD